MSNKKTASNSSANLQPHALVVDLNKLKHLLKAPLYKINLNTCKSDIKELITKTSISENNIGLVLPFDSPKNQLVKIFYIVIYSIKIKHLSKTMSTLSIENKLYGVYPSISKPVAVYQLNSPAEIYANQFILPAFTNGFNGMLRRLIMRITNFHPSIDGIILVLERTKK